MKTKQMNKAEAAPAQVAQHTPGPWEIVGPTEVWARASYSMICKTGGAYTPHNPNINKANARLIAAAPELLEALQAITGGMWIEEAAEVNSQVGRLLKQARAAIAKATDGRL